MKSVEERIADSRKKRKDGTLAAASNVESRIAKSRQERIIGFDTFESDLASASDLVNRVYSGWHSADDMKSSRQTVSAMRDRLTAYRGYANDNSNGQDLTEFNTGMDKLIGAYDAALTDWDALAAEYARYTDADSYGVAKKNSERYNKYKGLDFDGVQKAIKENPDDAEFLSRYGLNVGYADKKDMEKEIGAVDYYIANTTGAEQKAWKDYKNRLYEAAVNQNALFKGSEAFADGYQPGDVLDTVGATAADVVVRGSKGIASALEGLGDLATYGVAGLAGLVGADGASQYLKDLAKQDMTDDLYRPYYSTSVHRDSVLGGLGTAVAEGVGQMGFNLATAMMGSGAGLGKVGTELVSKGALFSSAAGNSMSEAYKNGATDGEALAYGLLSGTVETGSEMMFGGLGKAVNSIGLNRGIAGFDDMLAKKIGGKINNFVLRNAAEMGIKATGEGVEEVVAGLGSAVAKKLTYMSDEDLGKLVKDEELLNQFLVGTLSSAVTQTPSLVQSYKYGTDYVTNRTAAEEFVISSDYEARLAEAEKDGKKLSNREKDKLYRQVEEDLTAEQKAAYESVKRNAPNAVGRVASMDVSDTVDNATGASIKVQGIRTDESGNTVLKTSAGEKAIDSVTLNRRDAELVAMAEGMEPSQADLFVSMYSGQDTTTYKDSFDMAYAYGKNAYGVETAIKRRGVLTEAQALKVYKLGISERTSSQQKQIDAITEKHFAEGGKMVEGKFDDTGVDYTKLNNRQKAAASFAKMFSKATGVNVVLFESKADENGVRKAENGRYESGTNTIYMDVYAGFMESAGVVEDAMIPTLSHELTHWMKEKAPEAYANLSGIVMDTLSQHHKAAPEVLVAAEKKRHKDNGRDVSDEYAQDELIARACEDMLSGNKTAAEIIEKMDAETAKTFSEKFKEVVSKIRAWLKDLLKVYKSNSEEAKILRQYDSKLAELQKAWDEAFAKAMRSNQAINEQTEKVGVSVDLKTNSAHPSSQLSERTWTQSDYVKDRKAAASALVKALGITKAEANKYIDDINGVARMIAGDRLRLDYEPSPNRSAFVGNTEYGGSIDFSTICKKRRLFTGTFEAVQAALPNTALTAEEVLLLRDMMKKKNHEVSCGLCYVEGSRANMGQYTKQFIERYKATNPEYVPNMAEMNTATGQEKIRKEHPEVYEAYEYFMNHYGRLNPTDKAIFASQQKPKMYQMATEYNGEILKEFGKDGEVVSEKNKNGGLRLQSFSDFEIIHLIDCMQVIMDMSRVGLAGQAYTKVPDFAWALGDTGLKINLSLIAKGVDKNGRLVLDEVEGMKESDAMALRNRYSDNVGTIIVVFDDQQLKAAMADERIDYIIPYHRSQWKKDQYEMMGLPEGTRDYTNFQNESYIEPVYNKSGKKQRPSNYMPNAYWDFDKSGKENAAEYLRMCAENNRRPKFYHLLVDNHDGSYSLQPDGSTDGYWKTLIDFKMYNNEGQGVPQNPVAPNFNMIEAERMLNEYNGGHADFPVAEDVVKEFVAEYKKGHPQTQYSDRVVGEAEEFSDSTVQYSLREEAPPKATGKAYKVFLLKNGQLYPPMVANPNGEGTPVGVWLNADAAPRAEDSKTGRPQVQAGGKGTNTGKMTLAYRPGWHLGDVPQATQFAKLNPETGAKELFPANFVWAECEYAMDVDYQEEAMSYGYNKNGKFQHSLAGLPKIPKDGYYRYRTNPRPDTVPWVITGAMKVNRILVDEETDAICRANGVEPLKRQGGALTAEKLAEMGMGRLDYEGEDTTQYSTRDVAKLDSDYLKAVQNGDVDTAQKMVDEAARAKGYSEKVYHGTDAEFTIFETGISGGIYMATNRKVAEGFSKNGNVKSLYTKFNNPMVIDALIPPTDVWGGYKMPYYWEIPTPKEMLNTGEYGDAVATEEISIYAQANGYDGVIIHNMKEGNGLGTSDYIAFAPNQIKSADAVTYDDAGNVIPLSQRFNAASEDIRYSERGASLTIDRIDKDLRYYGASDERYAQGYFTSIHPRDFLSLTIRDEVLERWEEAVGTDSELYPLDVDKLRNQEQTPYLIVDTETGEVVGHEGRHRMRALLAEGVTSVPIIVIDRNTKYSKKKEYAMVLTSQDYGHGPVNNGAVATVKNLIPTNAKYRDEIIAYYGGESAVQYSERQTESIYDAVGELKRIQRENDKLKADIERLRKKNRLERTVTGGRELNESHIAAVAGRVLKLADSRYSRTDLASELKGIYEYLQGEDVAWDVFMSKATDLAQRVVSEARERKVTDDYAKMILSTIRSARISLNDTQKAEAEYAYGKNWNRSFFGRVTIANDGIPLESVWSEWAAMYPDVFDAEISDADMVTALLDIYDSTRTASEVVETYDKSEAARALAFEIYNQFWNVAPVRTLADKHDKEVKRLKFEHRQEMKELREKTDKKVFETQWHYSKLIHEVREARDEKIAQLKKESHEYTKQYREKIERRNQISQITKKSLKLNTWLKKNSKDEHIVEELKAPVAAVLRALDFSSERFLGTGVPTQKDISLKSAFEHLYKSIYDIDKRQGEDDYSIDMPVDYVEFLESMKDQVNGIVERVGDNEHVLRDMTLEQLQDMNKMLSVLTHIVTSANKALADANGKAISTMAQSTMLYANDLGPKSKKVGAASDFFNFDNGLPVYVFKMMGEGGQRIFRNMQDGWDKMAFHVKQIVDYSKDCYTAKEVKEWSKEIHEFTFADGSTVQMTTAQIMSLYCLQKREQARLHLLKGGMRVADFKVGTDTITNEDGVLLLPHEIDKVVSALTGRQKKVAEGLQLFMNTVCSDWGNEVSMRRFGIKSFGEENYFPIQSDASVVTGGDTPKTDRGSEVFRLLNMDFTKALNAHANNRIVVDNIFDVFATHTSDMAKYNALALPVLDMFRWYNYKESYRINPEDPEDTRMRAKSLKQSLRKAYGDGSTKYIMQFMKDINGAHSGGMSNIEKLGRKMISNYKVAAVGANIRVTILQPTSYVRASAVIDPKYLTAALAHKPQIQKAKDTCGIALWKSLGFYDTNISRGVASLIKHDERWYHKAREISMKLAEWGDSMTWGYLYNACEAEIKATQPGLTGEGKDRAVADRLREVIYATQVVDSTMTRTQNMRNPSTMNQIMTSFMSEPSLSYNLLHDLYIQYNADKRQIGKNAAFRKNGKHIARVTASYLVTLCCASLAGGFIDTIRDDEDEEEFFEKLLSNAAENAVSDALSMLPVIKDAVSIYKGFNVGRMDMQGIQSSYYAFRKLYKAFTEGEWDYKTVYSLITSVTKAVSQNIGLPASNLLRDVTAIWNSTIGEVYESLKVK